MSAPMEQRTCHYWFSDRHPLKKCKRGRYPIPDTRVLILIAAVAAFLLLQPPSAGAAKEVRRVLILNVFGPLSSPGVALIDQAIVAGLEKAPYQIELYHEEMESALFPDEASQRDFREWFIRRYSDRKPDVIITVGPSPLNFMVESHEEAFPGIPIIFCGSTEEMLGGLKLDSDFTGTWGVAQPEKTLIAALRLLPSTKHLVVVGGVGLYERDLESVAKKSFQGYESKLDITYLTDLDMPTLIERLKHLPTNTIVYHTAITQDAAGTRFIDATQSVPMIAGAANAPVFVVDDVDVGRGSTGGYVLSLAAEGRTAAEMAVRVLKGEKPANIPVVKSPNIYMFDWRAMQRFGLKESTLPPGSMVLNRQPTIWETYQRYILGVIFLILLETLLILGLLWQRARRRRVESELAVAHDRLRLAVEAGKSSGWEWDIKSGRVRRFGDLHTIYGIPSYAHSGNIDDFRRHVHPEDRELVWNTLDDSRQNQNPYFAEFRVIRNDETIRWIGARGRFYYAKNGEAERMLGMTVDITERKLAEEALKKSEEKFSTAFRESPMALTLTSMKDHRYLDVNETFEHLTGWHKDEVIGRTPFDINVWDDPFKRLEISKRLLSEGAIRNYEFQFRCRDGTTKWGLGSAELIEVDNETSMLSVVADITERRQIQEKLRTSEEMLAGVIASAMDAIIAVDSEQRIVLFNAAAEKIFGCRAEEAIGTSLEQFIPHHFRAAHFDQTGTSNRIMGTLGALWGLRVTGEEFPIEASVSQVGTAGKKLFTVIIRDITERRRAEQAIRESEERFRLVANTAPVLIWMSGPDKLCTYFNQPWLEFTGRPIEAELGNGWADDVHPEDLSACLDTYTNAFDRHESFKMQYRLRRNDGEYRWVFDLGVPRFNPDGSFAGYIGSCIDITERKMAEETLASLSGRLIEAQEEECRRIAREIHDDYNQRLAMLANELEDMAQSIGDSVAEAGPRLHELWNSVSELGVDLHSLSHRLHSSTLETLGLVAGVRAFCEEFEDLQEIQVEFTHENVPRAIPADVSLCLFRIAQEGLRNVKRHSGASSARVHLDFVDGKLHLSVSDQGRGFNPARRSARDGIGIRSMEERLHFIGGQLEVRSQPLEGTSIDAWAPFKASA
ncbi:PAS domain S-box protein [Alloacidobacterium dinghuense]|uniref:histidine kinase n=1 Tax=Alloacidobacterium dinghuense TaxID=2763107 RepID=A0A7G8BF16_9BACT|nr:ABC transporter substrate binding protein [Alloacidobacterium dinghuense]QNI31136.1 PAS domain S-box protein [Alloacidobacterium dinghuense]